MRIMNRENCINMVNKLFEFKLITEKQRQKIIRKRDNIENKQRTNTGEKTKWI